jgi:NagD protein
MGYRTILVLSGTTRRQDLQEFAYQPDLILDSIAQLNDQDLGLEQLVPWGNRADDTIPLP